MFPTLARVGEAINWAERKLDGSIAEAVWPSALDDAINQFAYAGTLAPSTAGTLALETGGGGILGKIGGKAVSNVAEMDGWLKSADPAQHLRKRTQGLIDQGKTADEIIETPLWKNRENIVNSTDYYPLPVDQIPNRPQLQDNLYQGATRLGWADEGLEGAAKPVPKGQKPTAVLVTGPAASGKSAVANPIARQYNAAIVDPDEAKKMLPGFDGGMGANAVHNQSKDMAKQLQDELMRDNYNLVIPTVGSSPEKVLAKADQLRAAGYDVQLLNMDVPAAEAGNRMLLRSAKTGRHIPMEVFAKDAKGAGETFGVLKSNQNGLFDGVSQVRNGADVPRVGPKPITMNSGLLDYVPGLTVF